MPAPPGSAPASAAAPISDGNDMTEASEWTGSVGTAWAEEWRRTDRSFAGLTSALLDPEQIGPFDSALDIGCGAGELALALAAAHPASRVRGIDISPELIAIARERGAGRENLTFEDADASRWTPPPDDRPDLLISRHGVMFFADPVAAFTHLRAQVAPTARLRFSCFRAREDNAWATALAAALPPQPATDPHAPGPFAFADPTRVAALLVAAGWSEIDFEPVDYAMIAGEGSDAAEEAFAYFQRIGPAARALREIPAAERPAALARLRMVIADHHEGERVMLPAAAWIVTARAPEMRARL